MDEDEGRDGTTTLAAVADSFETERQLLKERFDRVWAEDPRAALPVLHEMEELVDRMREFDAVREGLGELMAVLDDLEATRSDLVAGLERLTVLSGRFEASHPGIPSRDLCAALERADPTGRVVAALMFRPAEDLRVLLATAQRLGTRPAPAGSDAEEAPAFRRRHGNEIAFADLFDQDVDDRGARVVTVITGAGRDDED